MTDTEPRCGECGHGTLRKHCPATNRCAWWRCDLCGCTVDVSRGLVVLGQANGSIESGTDERDDGGEEVPT